MSSKTVLKINNKKKIFNLNNLRNYPNLKKLVIDKYIINSFLEINKILEILNLDNINTLECNFCFRNNNISLTLKKNILTIVILNFDNNIKDFLLNLPNDVNILDLYITDYKQYYYLENCFVNLPTSLMYIDMYFENNEFVNGNNKAVIPTNETNEIKFK